jgi:hypothetical protein
MIVLYSDAHHDNDNVVCLPYYHMFGKHILRKSNHCIWIVPGTYQE